MAKFETSVPEHVATELTIEAAFRAVLDENERNFRAVSTAGSVSALMKAVFMALDEHGDSQEVGLSVSRKCEGDAVEWIVHLGLDYTMTIICSEFCYSDDAPEEIAKIILGCWDTEWDDK